jgi:hypothetical protein
LKRVTRRIFTISTSDFIQQAETFIFWDDLYKKTAKNCETISAHSKVLFGFLGLSKKSLSRDTIPLTIMKQA